MAQTVERQHLIGLGQPHFPRQTGIFDRGLRAGTRAAAMARNHDSVGLGLGHTGGNGADAGTGDQLDRYGCFRVDLLQIVDELRQILDRIDVMMRRWRNQRYTRRGVAQLADEFRHLEARQLPAFTGLCALCDLDLDLAAIIQILGGHTETTRSDLLDLGAGIVAIRTRREARRIFATLTRIRLGTDAVHGNGERLMRFWLSAPSEMPGATRRRRIAVMLSTSSTGIDSRTRRKSSRSRNAVGGWRRTASA